MLPGNFSLLTALLSREVIYREMGCFLSRRKEATSMRRNERFLPSSGSWSQAFLSSCYISPISYGWLETAVSVLRPAFCASWIASASLAEDPIARILRRIECYPARSGPSLTGNSITCGRTKISVVLDFCDLRAHLRRWLSIFEYFYFWINFQWHPHPFRLLGTVEEFNDLRLDSGFIFVMPE